MVKRDSKLIISHGFSKSKTHPVAAIFWQIVVKIFFSVLQKFHVSTFAGHADFVYQPNATNVGVVSSTTEIYYANRVCVWSLEQKREVVSF